MDGSLGGWAPEIELVEEAPRPGFWNIVQVEANREATTATRLGLAGITAYLPLFAKNVRQAHMKRQVVMVPLFPGYLFALVDRLEDQLYHAVKAVRGVRHCMWVDGRPVRLAESKIDAIRQTEFRIAEEAGSKPGKKRKGVWPFKIGNTVEIDRGEWMGHLATIERLDDRGRIGVLLTLFGRLTPMEVSVNQVHLV